MQFNSLFCKLCFIFIHCTAIYSLSLWLSEALKPLLKTRVHAGTNFCYFKSQSFLLGSTTHNAGLERPRLRRLRQIYVFQLYLSLIILAHLRPFAPN